MSKGPNREFGRFFNQSEKNKAQLNGGRGSLNSALLIYNRNMAALSKRYPFLAEQVQRVSSSDNYEICPGNGKNPPNFLVRSTGSKFYGEDPWQDVTQQLAELKLKNTRMAVFLGMGLGYEVVHYAMQLSDAQKTSFFLIIEKDLEVFRLALQSIDLVQLIEHPGVEWVIGVDADQLYPLFRNLLEFQGRFIFLKAMNPVYHTSSLRLNKDYYLQALKVLREAGSHQILHFGNDPHDSLIGIENMLENIGEIITNPGINKLYQRFKDKPAIIVSTGPSLNQSKHLLKGLEDKALILCPDTSLKVLLDIGIKPHMVMSLERTASNAKLLKGFTADQVGEVYLAACPVVMKEAFEEYPGPRIIVYRDFDHFRWLGVERGTLHIQKSGSNMAFKVAEALGCDPIILIGQDLAFGEDGKTHAAGTARGDGGEKLDVFQQRGTLEVPGNYAKTVMTSTVWHTFLRVFEMDIAAYKGTCINSTAGGAFIPGTRVMPFEAAIAEYLKQPFAPLEMIKEGLQEFRPNDVAEDFQRISVLVDETIVDIETIIDHCRKGIEVWEKYKADLESCFQEPEKLALIRKKISAIIAEVSGHKEEARKLKRTFQLLLTHVFQSFHIQHEMKMVEIPSNYEDADLGRVEIALRQAEWYAVIGDLSMICLASLQQARLKINQMMQADKA